MTKDQAEAIGNAILLDGRRPPSHERMVNRPIFGALCLGLFLGTVIGMTVCHWLTGRYTPGAFVGETFGAAIGALAGIFFDRHLPKRSKRTFVVVAVTLFAIGAMPLLVTILRHGVR